MRKDAELTFENARVVRAAPLNICRAIRKHWRGQSSSPVQLANLRLRRGVIETCNAAGSTVVATYELDGVGHAVVSVAGVGSGEKKEIDVHLDAGVSLSAAEEAALRADVDRRANLEWLLSEEDHAFYTTGAAAAVAGLDVDAALAALRARGLDDGNDERRLEQEKRMQADDAARWRHEWRKNNADSYDSAESDEDL